MVKSTLDLVERFELSSETPPDQTLSPQDYQRCKSFLALWICLVVDIVGPRYPRDVSTKNVEFFIRCWYGSMLSFQEVLDHLLMILRRVNPLETKASLIRRRLRSDGLNLGQWEFMLFRSLIGEFLRGNADAFYELNTICQFMKRCTLKDRDELEQEALDRYWDVEKDLRTEFDPNIVSAMSRELAVFHLDPDDFIPGHGNGATAETSRHAGSLCKEMLFTNDSRTQFLLRRLGYDNRVDGTVRSYSETTLHLQTVPKGFSKKRMISLETIAKQYVEHGVSRMFDVWFSKHPSWGVDLHDQTHNTDLCLAGNITGEYATIDLSDASDRNVFELIKAVVPHDNLLYLVCCHTDQAEYYLDECRYVRPIRKYGGMGNAVTFCTMSLILSAAIRVAQKLSHSTHNYYRVYGDDMICHKDCYEAVLFVLEQLGFKVNLEKTFEPDSYFHESCGIEVYLGQDVTPLRISRKCDPARLADHGSTTVASFVDLANNAYERGYRLLRRHLVRHIMREYPLWPFGDTEGMLRTETRQINKHLPYRWNADLQRYECKVMYIRSDEKEVHSAEEHRLNLTLEATCHRTSTRPLRFPEDRVLVAGGPKSSSVSTRWEVVKHYLFI